MLSSTVSSGSSRRPSGTIAIPARRIRSGRRPARSRPSRSTDPARGLSTPPTASTRLDLPGAVRPEQRGHLAGRYLDRHVADHGAPAARHGEAAQVQAHAGLDVAPGVRSAHATSAVPR